MTDNEEQAHKERLKWYKHLRKIKKLYREFQNEKLNDRNTDDDCCSDTVSVCGHKQCLKCGNKDIPQDKMQNQNEKEK